MALLWSQFPLPTPFLSSASPPLSGHAAPLGSLCDVMCPTVVPGGHRALFLLQEHQTRCLLGWAHHPQARPAAGKSHSLFSVLLWEERARPISPTNTGWAC